MLPGIFHKFLKSSLVCQGTVHSVRSSGVEGFRGVMKYFKHILMGHENFFKIFEGPQNTLCFIFVFFFKVRMSEHKISKVAIKKI